MHFSLSQEVTYWNSDKTNGKPLPWNQRGQNGINEVKNIQDIMQQHQTERAASPEHNVYVVTVERPNACYASLWSKSAVNKGNRMEHCHQGMDHDPAVLDQPGRDVAIAGERRSLLHHHRLNNVVALPREDLFPMGWEKLAEMSHGIVLPFDSRSLPFLEPCHRIK